MYIIYCLYYNRISECSRCDHELLGTAPALIESSIYCDCDTVSLYIGSSFKFCASPAVLVADPL